MKKILLTLVFLLMITACGAKESASTEEMKASYDYAGGIGATGGNVPVAAENSSIESKIEYNTYISFETKDLDLTQNELLDIIKEFKGSIVNTSISTYGDNKEYRNSYLQVRIPVNTHENFVEKIKDVATLTYLSTSQNDVTKTYIDTDTKIKTLEAEEIRLNELLTKAESVSDIVTIEDKLSDVRSNIESLKSQRDYFDTITDNATISIDITQVTEYSNNSSFIDRIIDAFSNSFSNFLDFLQDVFIVVIYAIPFVLALILIIFIVVKINRRKRK